MSARLKLSELLHGVVGIEAELAVLDVNHVVLDSRKVGGGDVFVALPGSRCDGAAYVTSAVANGASAVLVDADRWMDLDVAVPVIKIKNLSNQLAKIADNCYDDPSAKLNLVAVTGTNGKTTCAHLIAQAFMQLGTLSAVIGTAGNGVIGALEKSELTTPDVFSIRRLLAEFVAKDVKTVVFEASSHGLKQGRLDALKLNTAVFTNLSHDHLDYHPSLADYAESKLKLFNFTGLTCAVMNADQPLVPEFAKRTSADAIWNYGSSASAEVSLLKYKALEAGLFVELATGNGQFQFNSRLVGRINVENLLAVFTVLLASGYSEQTICQVMPELNSVPGRMELFGGDVKPVVVVDYAHTPDALEKACESLQEHRHDLFYCVFGCGGDRDQAKRPKMGRVAQQYADVAVITNDNPRHEDPDKIIEDILSGMSSPGKIIADRSKAIHWAVSQAKYGDIVLIAGKGHEDTQQVGDQYLHLSDRALAVEALELWQ